MFKAQHQVLLFAFGLSLALTIEMVRTQQAAAVRRKDAKNVVQFNVEDNFRQARRTEQQNQQQELGKLQQILQQMLRSGIRQPVQRVDEDYSTQDNEDANVDYDNGAETEPDAQPDVDSEAADNDAGNDGEPGDDSDLGNEDDDNNANLDGDPGMDSNEDSNSDLGTGVHTDAGTENDTNSNTSSSAGCNVNSNGEAEADDDTFDEDEFDYNPYTNSFNIQRLDGTYVYGYALPNGVRRYERAFYSDKYKGLVVEGFSVEPRQQGQRLLYELRCYRSDAYGYRPLKVQYLTRPPTVQRDVEPNVDCFN